jgi:predicted transcriptional regulator/transcriptional regulator with XRE-family HTH domain
MKEKKLFAGARLKRLREKTGLKQSALAALAGVSPSYLNQIESDQRPLTAALLARLAAIFKVAESSFGDSDELRRASDLREALHDPVFGNKIVPAEELQALVRVAPEISDMFMTLYRDYLRREEQHREALIRSADEPVAGFASRFPYDEVRDWVQAHHNYFDTLDRTAEQVFEDNRFDSASLRDDLTRYLLDRHGITIGGDTELLGQGTFWRLNKAARRLVLAEDSSLESKIFWMAHVIGHLDQKHRIEREVRRADFSSEEAQKLARIALANYFAGALMMPYRRFNDYARAVRYDVQRLQYYVGASFEQVCHRLSTMQRADMRGIPFYFAKTDIAGNILKRSSATAFQFAQFGGPCPVWNVYRAFAHPNEILVQMAITPDATRYLNIARTVGRGGGSYLSRPRSVAVVLGCEISHAAQTVYAAGLDLHNPDAADPIGPGCRACERTTCRHRSVPPIGRGLDVGTAERGVVPYRVAGV